MRVRLKSEVLVDIVVRLLAVAVAVAFLAFWFWEEFHK